MRSWGFFDNFVRVFTLLKISLLLAKTSKADICFSSFCMCPAKNVSFITIKKPFCILSHKHLPGSRNYLVGSDKLAKQSAKTS